MRSFSNGLARAAVRFKPSAFAGTCVALALAALIVSACGILLEGGIRADVPPTRYSETPVVVAADQRAHFVTGHGEDREDDPVPVPDRARLDAGLLAKAARTPQVADAALDLTFPVQAGPPTGNGSRSGSGPRSESGSRSGSQTESESESGPGRTTETGRTSHPAKAPLTAHGWGSAPFTGAALRSGTAPREGEAVLDAAAAEAVGARPGRTIALTTAVGERQVRISGLVTAASGEPGRIWFDDAQARRLSGHPDAVDALLLRPAPGTSPEQLADRVEKNLRSATDGGKSAATTKRLEAYTGGGRGGVEEPGLAGAKEVLIALGGSFGGVATMVAVFTAAATVALCVAQRAREFALLRAIGATPRQIRRSIATETLLVAPVAGALGLLPGIALAHWWFGELKERGAIPEPVTLEYSWIPLVTAVGAVVVTALLSGLMAARRPARIKPGQALGEAAVERLRPGVIRTVLGLGALVGGVLMTKVAAGEAGEDAASAALGVVMLFMLAVAFLGPLLARLCAWLLGLPLRGGPAAAHLAAANSRANARRMASAITPLVLAMAFGSTLVFLQTSQDHVARGERDAAIVADHVVTDPDGLAPGSTRRAAEVPGVAAAVGVTRTDVLVRVDSAGAYLQSTPAQGVSDGGRALGAVQDLDVRAGRLADLRPGTVAVDERLADAAHARLGDRLDLRLPDGTRHRPEVVAVYARGLGVAQVTLDGAALRPHLTAPLDTELLVRERRSVSEDDRAALTAHLSALGEVTDRDGYRAARNTDLELNAWANTTMAAVLGGFAAVTAANTLVMTVLDRRRELGTLRLVGTTRRQIMHMLRWEALLVTVAGTVLGTVIALVTLHPMTRGITGEVPHIPLPLYAAFAGTILTLGLAATALPARAVLRTGPLDDGVRG
ncbi:FtsX-like permease family protein [Streptomyces sp. NA04227]|uniref:FtsX-like permease family protein n=1 Tax=Streptomyces sp. NA04227 TaxID=2742136 RepID=UPI00159216CC|nr:FtsX-like permease family protein [Streptomyces sp. NA04227]QKW06468.1 FtsX-like permease family protein [Streptomyces sp. NA04227]